MSDSIFDRMRDRTTRAAERVAEQRAPAEPEPAPVARVEREARPKRAKKARAEVIDAPARASRAPMRLPRIGSIGGLAKLAGAAFIWWWGLGNTSAFLGELRGAEVALIWAAGVQALLTALESDFFGGRRGSRLAQIALAADTLTNVVGVWVYIPNIPQTGVYRILATVVPLPAALDAGAPRFVVAVVAGALIAWAPEALWKSASN